jgi:hypothetical protein
MAGLGKAGKGGVGHGRRGVARPDQPRSRKAGRVTHGGPGMARQGELRHGEAWRGMARHGRRGQARCV